MDRYESFLFLIGAVFVPLFGVVIFDYFLYRKRKVDVAELYEKCPMLVWQGVVAWAVGLLLYEVLLYTLPALGASVPSFLVAGGLYLLLRRNFFISN